MDVIIQPHTWTCTMHTHYCEDLLIIETLQSTRHTGVWLCVMSVTGHMWVVCPWSLPTPLLVTVSTLMVSSGGEGVFAVAPQTQLLPSFFCLISVMTEESRDGGREWKEKWICTWFENCMSVFNKWNWLWGKKRNVWVKGLDMCLRSVVWRACETRQLRQLN